MKSYATLYATLEVYQDQAGDTTFRLGYIPALDEENARETVALLNRDEINEETYQVHLVEFDPKKVEEAMQGKCTLLAMFVRKNTKIEGGVNSSFDLRVVTLDEGVTLEDGLKVIGPQYPDYDILLEEVDVSSLEGLF